MTHGRKAKRPIGYRGPEVVTMTTDEIVKIIKKWRREYKREAKAADGVFRRKYGGKSLAVRTSGEAQNRLKIRNMYQDKVDACNAILAEIHTKLTQEVTK